MTETASPQYVWFPYAVPANKRIAQVYGWLFDHHGRVLIQETAGGWNLPGGSPEDFDESSEATLRREALEESQVEIDDLAYLGYESGSHENNAACTRYAGLIAGFRPRHADPDGGALHGRWLVPLDEACRLLGWGEAGTRQAAAAAAAAGSRWRLPVECPTAAAQHED
ncbi:NUDIX hydrolase [Kribbella sp. NPDC059898]|uniref:NUDIX hydrolase n=1 Tax=Kribbella sp. NPDC059898 TaxID=3346995 RepID=UPI0036501E7F